MANIFSNQCQHLHPGICIYQCFNTCLSRPAGRPLASISILMPAPAPCSYTHEQNKTDSYKPQINNFRRKNLSCICFASIFEHFIVRGSQSIRLYSLLAGAYNVEYRSIRGCKGISDTNGIGSLVTPPIPTSSCLLEIH